jgi:hypothetical protein
MRAHGDKDVTHLLLDSNILPEKGFPIKFHGVKGTEKRTRRSPSYFNIHEASVVRNYCVALTEDQERKICKCSAPFGLAVFSYLSVDPSDIGVIAPRKLRWAQLSKSRDKLVSIACP